MISRNPCSYLQIYATRGEIALAVMQRRKKKVKPLATIIITITIVIIIIILLVPGCLLIMFSKSVLVQAVTIIWHCYNATTLVHLLFWGT